MKETTYRMEMSDFQRRALLGVLVEMRNQCLQTDFPTEDVNDLLELALDAVPQGGKKKDKRGKDRDER